MNKVQDYKLHSFYKLVKKRKQKITLKVGVFVFCNPQGLLSMNTVKNAQQQDTSRKKMSTYEDLQTKPSPGHSKQVLQKQYLKEPTQSQFLNPSNSEDTAPSPGIKKISSSPNNSQTEASNFLKQDVWDSLPPHFFKTAPRSTEFQISSIKEEVLPKSTTLLDGLRIHNQVPQLLGEST